ncbi:MAG: TRAP transporter large permease subunit [Akkermansiaceae bacterium]|nr:TRAP transporter large permease subunit [Akkermansiaceae bacterium]
MAAYIIGAILFVPAMLDFGLPKLASHLFVMYYCVLSMVTPPIALASYTAAGLAGAPVMKTCFAALRLSAAAFVIPFAFLFSPALLAQGSFGTVAAQVAVLLTGTAAWAVVAEGYLLGRLLNVPQRLWLGLSAVFLLTLPASVHGLAPQFGWTPAFAWPVGLAAALLSLAAGAAWCLLNEKSTHGS